MTVHVSNASLVGFSIPLFVVMSENSLLMGKIFVLGCQSLSAISASSMYKVLYTAINVRDGPASSGGVAGTNSGAFFFFWTRWLFPRMQLAFQWLHFVNNHDWCNCVLLWTLQAEEAWERVSPNIFSECSELVSPFPWPRFLHHVWVAFRVQYEVHFFHPPGVFQLLMHVNQPRKVFTFHTSI